MTAVRRWTGLETRALRMAMRLSVRAFAEHLGVAVRTVSKWETGTGGAIPRPDTQSILDTALSRADPAAQERFALLCRNEDGNDGQGTRRPSRSAPRLPCRSTDCLDSDLIDSDTCEGCVGAESETSVVDRRDFVRAGFAALAVGTGQRRDPREFDAALTELQAVDSARGPEESVIGVTQLLRELAAELRGARGTDRASLLRTGARSAEFAGFLCRDLGRPDRTLFWHDRAMDWAQESQDQPMQAYVLLRKAQAAYDQRDAERMLGLTRAARRFERAVPAGLRAEMLQQEARGEAMLGLPDHGVLRKLDEARTVLANRGPADHGAAPGSRYTGKILDLQIAVCLTEAGRPRDAVAAYRDFLDRAACSARDRAYFSTLMATALALSGEPDDAAHTVRAALPVAVESRSRRTLREALIVASTLRPWSNRSAVRDLDEALVDALSQRTI